MKILKIIGLAFCGLMVFAGTLNTISPPQPGARAENLVLTLIFLVLAALLIRSIRKGGATHRESDITADKPVYAYHTNSKTVSSYLPEVPVEILRDMKKHYTAIQIQNDFRIMQESFQIVQQTTDFDTFFMRLDLARKKALTLLQAVQAGCKGIQNKKQTIKGCEAVLSSTQVIKMVFLDNSYKKETTSALQLKTKAGQYKRLVAYLDKLNSYEDRFSDVKNTYDGVMSQLQGLISERRPEGKGLARSESDTKGSSADEILKFKRLLDAGAITQDEYETKKKQLLEL